MPSRNARTGTFQAEIHCYPSSRLHTVPRPANFPKIRLPVFCGGYLFLPPGGTIPGVSGGGSETGKTGRHFGAR